MQNYHIRYMKNSICAANQKNGGIVGSVSGRLSSAPSNGHHNDTSVAMAAARSLTAPLPKGWERGRTDENIPYYLNHADATTQWDHPKYTGN